MGIIVLDSIETIFGSTHTGIYISTANTQIVSDRSFENGEYAYTCSFNMWVSKAARDAGKPVVGRVNIRHVSATPINTSVYDLLYAELKAKYPNSQDA